MNFTNSQRLYELEEPQFAAVYNEGQGDKHKCHDSLNTDRPLGDLAVKRDIMSQPCSPMVLPQGRFAVTPNDSTVKTKSKELAGSILLLTACVFLASQLITCPLLNPCTKSTISEPELPDVQPTESSITCCSVRFLP